MQFVVFAFQLAVENGGKPCCSLLSFFIGCNSEGILKKKEIINLAVRVQFSKAWFRI
jgi:hypothetical protein